MNVPDIPYREPTQQDRRFLIDVLESRGYRYHHTDPNDYTLCGPVKNFFVYFTKKSLCIVHHECECCQYMGNGFHTKEVLTDIIATLGKLDIEAIYHVRKGWGDRLYVFIPEHMICDSRILLQPKEETHITQ